MAAATLTQQGSVQMPSSLLHPMAAPIHAATLVALCARAVLTPQTAVQLKQAVARFEDWAALPALAERHGLGPLVYTHLRAVGAEIPAPTELTLKGLCLRHQRAAQIYDQVLGEILQTFYTAGIDVLVLKGSALAHLLYPQPGLRPRRDLDLLVRPEAALHAYALLGTLGFVLAPTPYQDVSRYHQHLAPATRTVQDYSVMVDLHTDLFFRFKPYHLPSATYSQLSTTAQPFTVNGLPASTLSPAAMLWHLYHHGFSMHLRGDTQGRLLGVADIVTLVEKWLDRIDWEHFQRCYPQTFHALPMFHYLTPWSDAVLERLQWRVGPTPGGVGEVYAGYPTQLAGEHLRRGLRRSCRETFWPSEWWVRLHYGLPATTPTLVGRARHAVYVLWDLGIYATSLLGPLKLHPYPR
ncbi:MAG: nucleotidyltransferase domain-containing protein [Caldilinea sp.]